MTAGDLKNGASRLWGAVDRIALTLAIAFGGYLFTSQQEMGRGIERTNQRVTVIETVQLEGPRGYDIVSRLATLEAEMRELRRSIDRSLIDRSRTTPPP